MKELPKRTCQRFRPLWCLARKRCGEKDRGRDGLYIVASSRSLAFLVLSLALRRASHGRLERAGVNENECGIAVIIVDGKGRQLV